jgi:DNA-binding LacI/PurR family transcriptional regulator
MAYTLGRVDESAVPHAPHGMNHKTSNLRLSRTALAKAALVERIRKGEFGPGERIPPERELALQFGFSRVLVGNLLRELARDGWVRRRTGSGTYVSETAPALSAGLKRIGFVASNRESPISQRILEGLQGTDVTAECDVTVKDPRGDPREEQRLVRGLLNGGIQGLVVVTCFPCDSAEGLAFYEEIGRRVPLVLCDCDLQGDVPSVSTDNARCGELAATYLARTCPGNGLFWIVRRSPQLSSQVNRTLGCQKALQAGGAAGIRVVVLPPEPALQKQALVQALSEAIPMGAFMTSEVLLPPFFEALDTIGAARAGITLCCCDNFHSWASLYAVAHIEQPIREMTAEVVRELDRQLRRPDGVVRHVCLAPRLVLSGASGSG